MAKYDYGGGCFCGVYKNCICGLSLKPVPFKEDLSHLKTPGPVRHITSPVNFVNTKKKVYVFYLHNNTEPKVFTNAEEALNWLISHTDYFLKVVEIE